MRKIFFILILFIVALPTLAADSNIVVLNAHTRVYHNQECPWAHKCTNNCIKVEKEEAIKYGARPCKLCGG